MLILACLFIFLAVFAAMLAFIPLESRPKLKLDMGPAIGGATPFQIPKKTIVEQVFDGVRKVAVFNKPLTNSAMGQRIFRDLSLGQVPISTEEFFLIKEALVVGLVILAFRINIDPGLLPAGLGLACAAGYMLPEMWLKARVKMVKEKILKFLPDTVDLLGLCVNAGLDFMMALRYVVEKSTPNIVVEELRNMMQEINVGKPRRDALRDLARKYELPDLATFSRTLIQADRMGTSVSEALNILSEDMRETRFRRGEAMALKAPLKMLVPLLFCIFPVVAILVAGPIFLDFMHNNPVNALGK
jgi:tight adherence protein C